MELGRLLVNTQDLSSKLYMLVIDRAQHFKLKQPNEEVKKEFVELVKRCYFDWMFHIKNPIFKKYTEKEDRYKNGLSFIPLLEKDDG